MAYWLNKELERRGHAAQLACVNTAVEESTLADRAGARMLAQVQQLRRDSTVTSVSGHIIALQVDTLCVHGDNPESVQSIEAIRALVDGG